ncbi:MAG: DnaJ domain-containing protein [Candidatus Limnocylindrales bacterium]
MSEQDPYATLEVEPTASQEVISAAYRALARRFHPDVAPGPEAAARMVAINAAWELLRNPTLRANYDRQHGRTGFADPADAAAAAAAAGAYTPGGHRWQAGEAPGTGGAGAPPGRPSGSVLKFGRHIGWSIGEIARVDPGYLTWLEAKSEGRPYLAEIDETLRRIGLRTTAPAASAKRGRFGRG